MLEAFPRPEAVIVGEPSLMQVVTGHKAILGLDAHVRGHEVHSSLVHRGVSAVMTAARLVTWCEDQMLENRAAAAEGGGDARFEPPYTTLHVGRIEGGTAHNITARDCRFGVDIRVIPGERLEDWRDRFLARAAAARRPRSARVHPDAAIRVEVLSALPGCVPEPDGAAEALARRLTGDAGDHNVSYATEAGLFQAAGAFHRDLRAGVDRAGASAGRVHRGGPARGGRGVRAPPDPPPRVKGAPCPPSTASPTCTPRSPPGARTCTRTRSFCSTPTAPAGWWPSGCASSAATRWPPGSGAPGSWA